MLGNTPENTKAIHHRVYLPILPSCSVVASVNKPGTNSFAVCMWIPGFVLWGVFREIRRRISAGDRRRLTKMKLFWEYLNVRKRLCGDFRG